MSVEKELLQQGLGKYILDYMLEGFETEKLVETTAVEVLREIQLIFQDKEKISDDFLMVDEIITIFTKYGLDTGGCHDF